MAKGKVDWKRVAARMNRHVCTAGEWLSLGVNKNDAIGYLQEVVATYNRALFREKAAKKGGRK